MFEAAEGKPEKEGKEKVGIFAGHPISARESSTEAGWCQFCSVNE